MLACLITQHFRGGIVQRTQWRDLIYIFWIHPGNLSLHVNLLPLQIYDVRLSQNDSSANLTTNFSSSGLSSIRRFAWFFCKSLCHSTSYRFACKQYRYCTARYSGWLRGCFQQWWGIYWHLVEDHLGKTVYDVASGDALFILNSVPLPENVTWLSPAEFQVERRIMDKGYGGRNLVAGSLEDVSGVAEPSWYINLPLILSGLWTLSRE